MERRHFLVSGRVQGVGFRAFVERQARGLMLRGATRNLADGRVEVLALGERAALDALEAEVKKGPSHASVTSLDTRAEAGLEASPPWLEKSREFEILEDGDKPWH